ncbi:MAG TPA: hypothetical protein VKA26_02750 [Ignavibacteriaceae bacterium]|nr:hypothetical protein [Ignavibacteriaceae bacterium]
MTLKLVYTSIIVLVFNIPFGYWRESVKKFSRRWFLAIHLPVPFVIGLRFLFNLGFRFVTYPVLVGSFFSGQYIGAKIYSYRKSKEKTPLTSNLFRDIIFSQKE